ncbi:hypothetical protein K438DRAFT_1894049 [Mycena galopus ATCC 62051]|nr:hypothetical protein K438DRAFT_1894049 [Mycena galopus ATCC 62051]
MRVKIVNWGAMMRRVRFVLRVVVGTASPSAGSFDATANRKAGRLRVVSAAAPSAAKCFSVSSLRPQTSLRLSFRLKTRKGTLYPLFLASAYLYV